MRRGRFSRWLLVVGRWCIIWILLFGSFVFAEETMQTVTTSGEKISLDLRGIEITELFKILSLKTGLTIVPQAGVKGRVTLFLNNVRFEDVLDIILIAHNLACERRDNIINIMTVEQYYSLYGKRYKEKRQVKSFKLNYAKPVDVFNVLSQLKSDIGKIIVDESSATVILVDIAEKLDLMEGVVKQLDQESLTEVVSLRYAKAKDLEQQFYKISTPGAGEVFIDERSNKVWVKDFPGKMQKIKRMVRAFDEEPSQVLIEAEIIELSLSEKFQRGIDWEGIFRSIDNLDFKGNFTLGLTGTRQEISVGTLARDNYNAILQILQTYGRTHILSQPRIAVLNNQEAKILVGAREAYVTQTISTAKATTTTAESVEYIDVGIKFNVTPTISRDGFITMKLKPEISSVREYFTTKLGGRIPIVATSEAETVVKVKDGAMIMIAGLSKKKELEEIWRVPVISKVPILGMFFSKRIKGPDEPRYSELVVFITPQIISGDVAVSAKLSGTELVLKKALKGFKE